MLLHNLLLLLFKTSISLHISPVARQQAQNMARKVTLTCSATDTRHQQLQIQSPKLWHAFVSADATMTCPKRSKWITVRDLVKYFWGLWPIKPPQKTQKIMSMFWAAELTWWQNNLSVWWDWSVYWSSKSKQEWNVSVELPLFANMHLGCCAIRDNGAHSVGEQRMNTWD